MFNFTKSFGTPFRKNARYKTGACTICKNYTNELKLYDHNYDCNGTIENYKIMLFTCFNIQIKDKHNKAAVKICDYCIFRLKDACNFRKEIQSAGRLIFKKAFESGDEADGESLTKQQNEQRNRIYCQKDLSDTNFDNLDDYLSAEESSTTSEQMNIATGYVQQTEEKKYANILVPPLDETCKMCPKCSKEIEDYKLLVKHYQKHFLNCLCELCGIIYANVHSLNAHLKTTHRDKEIQCNFCKKIYKTKYGLNIHIQTYHMKIKRSLCPECPERFSHATIRNKHLAEVHGGKVPSWACETCHRIYYNKRLLKNHVKMEHVKEFDLHCPYCEKGFVDRSHLNHHIAAHTGANKHRCPHCPKEFGKKISLKKHLLTHNDIEDISQYQIGY